MTEYTKNVQMPNTFLFHEWFFRRIDWLSPLPRPSCSFSLILSTSHLLAPPAPLPSPPGGTEDLQSGTLSHQWAALHWWKSECVESLVELHCMYCIYGIKIVFCSSSRLFSASALPSGGQTRVFAGNLARRWNGRSGWGKKQQRIKKQLCLFANTNGGNVQFPVYQTPCWLLSCSKQTINTQNNC